MEKIYLEFFDAGQRGSQILAQDIEAERFVAPKIRAKTLQIVWMWRRGGRRDPFQTDQFDIVHISSQILSI